MKSKILVFGSFLTVLCLLVMCNKDDNKDVAITAISIPSSVPDMEITGTVEVTATVTPEKATGTITWSAADGKVTVTPVAGTNGRKATITAVSAGTTTVTASSGTIKSGNLSVTVKPAEGGEVAITAIAIPSSIDELEIDGDAEVTATVTPANATEAVEWVAVDGTGKVTVTPVAGTNGRKATIAAVSAGTATVTAKSASGTVTSNSLTVTVKEEEATPDYASDVAGTYYGGGDVTFTELVQAILGVPANGVVTNMVITLEKVDNNTVNMGFDADVSFLGETFTECELTVSPASSGYELTGEGKMPNPVEGQPDLNLFITGSLDTDGKLTLEIVADGAATFTLTAGPDAPGVDYASDVEGTYTGEGESYDGFYTMLDGDVTDITVVLVKADNGTVNMTLNAKMPMLGTVTIPCQLTVSSDYELDGIIPEFPNPLDETDTFKVIFTGSVDVDGKTIELLIETDPQRFTVSLTAVDAE